MLKWRCYNLQGNSLVERLGGKKAKRPGLVLYWTSEFVKPKLNTEGTISTQIGLWLIFMSSNCYLFISYNLQVPFWLCEQRVATQNNCSVKPFIGKWTHVASRIGAKSSPPHLLYWLWFHVLLSQDNSMTKPCWLRLTHGTLASSHNNGGNLLQEAS